MTQYLNPPASGRGFSFAGKTEEKPASTAHRFTRLSKGRTKQRGQMNQNESRYAEHLDARVAAGELVRYWFEPFSLRLSSPPGGQPASYTPDFMLLMPDGLTIVDDVKNSNIDDKAAIVRIKAAAELFPLWVFRLVRPVARKNGGGWQVQEV